MKSFSLMTRSMYFCLIIMQELKVGGSPGVVVFRLKRGGSKQASPLLFPDFAYFGSIALRSARISDKRFMQNKTTS
jgi:hypothetical protein